MLKPLADRVLIEVDVEETKTAGGILLPHGTEKVPEGNSYCCWFRESFR